MEPRLVVHTPLTRRRVLWAALSLGSVAAAVRLATWGGETSRDDRAPPVLPTPSPQVSVAIATGGFSAPILDWFRNDLERVLPEVNERLQGRPEIDLLVVTPADATSPFASGSQIAAMGALLSSGAPPDALALASWPTPGGVPREFATAAELGVLQPLDALLRRTTILPLHDFSPTALAICRHRGGLLAIPVRADPVLIAYDTVRLAEAGLSRPSPAWNWDRLLDAARVLTRSTADGGIDQYGFFAGFASSGLLNLIWQAGGDVLSPDKRRAQLDAPLARAAIDRFAALHRASDVALPRPPFSWQWSADGIRIDDRRWLASAYLIFNGNFPFVRGTPIRAAEPPRGRVQATAFGVEATLSLTKQRKTADLAVHALAVLADRAGLAVPTPARRLGRDAILAIEPDVTPETADAIVNAWHYGRAALLDDVRKTLGLHEILDGLTRRLQSAGTDVAHAVHEADRAIQSVIDR